MVTNESQRDEFIEENLGLVHAVAKRFLGRGIDYEDLYQTGCIGLIKAADAFDTERGLMFSTYAFPVIMGEIKRLFRDGGAVKVSRSLKELSLKVSRIKERTEAQTGITPTISELAEMLCVTKDEIVEAVCVAQPVMSLTYEAENGVREFDIATDDVEEKLSDRLLIDGMFKLLTNEEREIMRCRYYEGLTQSETAKRLSMSQVQVSRSEKKILLRLRGLIDENEYFNS